jgi:hypothetical protein
MCNLLQIGHEIAHKVARVISPIVCNFMCDLLQTAGGIYSKLQLRFHVLTVEATADTKLHLQIADAIWCICDLVSDKNQFLSFFPQIADAILCVILCLL